MEHQLRHSKRLSRPSAAGVIRIDPEHTNPRRKPLRELSIGILAWRADMQREVANDIRDRYGGSEAAIGEAEDAPVVAFRGRTAGEATAEVVVTHKVVN